MPCYDPWPWNHASWWGDPAPADPPARLLDDSGGGLANRPVRGTHHGAPAQQPSGYG
jgi:hypothetical protein